LKCCPFFNAFWKPNVCASLRAGTQSAQPLANTLKQRIPLAGFSRQSKIACAAGRVSDIFLSAAVRSTGGFYTIGNEISYRIKKAPGYLLQ